METNLGHQSEKKMPPPPLSFEQKLYRTLRGINLEMLSEYMESFGLEPERSNVGAQFKEFADRMTEEEFCTAMRDGSLPVAQLSPVEIEVLHRSHSDDFDPECGSSVAAPA